MTASEGGSEQEARRVDILLRSRNREGDRVQHHRQHHQVDSFSAIKNNNNNNTASNSATKQNNNNNNININSKNDKKATLESSKSSSAISENTSQEGRKLSYVGLSCAVSGYSPYTKYSTELTDIERKVTPPAQIPVASPPHTLDAVLNNFTPPMVKPGNDHSENNCIVIELLLYLSLIHI